MCEVTKKTCSKCGEEKPLTIEFFKFRTDTNKYRNDCKLCRSAYGKLYCETNKDDLKNKMKDYGKLYWETNKDTITEKRKERVSNMNKDELEHLRGKQKEYKKKYNDTMSEEKRIAKEQASEDKRIVKEQAKEEKRIAKEQAKEEKRIAKEQASEDKRIVKEEEKRIAKEEKKNRKKYPSSSKKREDLTEEERVSEREKKNEYRAKRRKEDPVYRMTNSLRSRLNLAIKKGCGFKIGTTTELLGCDWETVRNHLESQFIEGMDWENYGYYGWHVDHIRPCSSFDISDPIQQRVCFHYTNLQPIWAKGRDGKKGNLEKGDTWDITLQENIDHQEKLDILQEYFESMYIDELNIITPDAEVLLMEDLFE
jgi:hypothetical protein